MRLPNKLSRLMAAPRRNLHRPFLASGTGSVIAVTAARFRYWGGDHFSLICDVAIARAGILRTPMITLNLQRSFAHSTSTRSFQPEITRVYLRSTTSPDRGQSPSRSLANS